MRFVLKVRRSSPVLYYYKLNDKGSAGAIGEAQIVDSSKPDQVKTIKAGDVVYSEADSTLTWTALTNLKSKLPTTMGSVTHMYV